MAKSAEARYPSCRAMAEDLSRFLARPAFPPPAEAPPVSAAAPAVALAAPGGEAPQQQAPTSPLPWPGVLLAAAMVACLLITLMTAVAGAGTVFIVTALMAVGAIQYYGIELTRQRHSRRRRRR
jgi:hypothetical protein